MGVDHLSLVSPSPCSVFLPIPSSHTNTTQTYGWHRNSVSLSHTTQHTPNIIFYCLDELSDSILRYRIRCVTMVNARAPTNRKPVVSSCFDGRCDRCKPALYFTNKKPINTQNHLPLHSIYKRVQRYIPKTHHELLQSQVCFLYKPHKNKHTQHIVSDLLILWTFSHFYYSPPNPIQTPTQTLCKYEIFKDSDKSVCVKVIVHLVISGLSLFYFFLIGSKND